jgi:predicted dehydrogenase
VYDRDRGRADAVAAKHGAAVCSRVEDLLEACEAVSICTPTTNHHEVALAAFVQGVHVLVEKPIAATSAEGEEMVRSADEHGCLLQVGHIERFNGAFRAAQELLRDPLFIESHRLAAFTPRGTDVSVVVDLMIHDIDLILTVLRERSITDLRASGAGVITDSPDIVNARIEFSNGCVANITASRISREPMRKIRFFQENRYISVDLKQKTVEAFERAGDIEPERFTADPSSFIRRLPVSIDETEPLTAEIRSFTDAITGSGVPVVTGEEGLQAVRVAEEILRRIEGVGRGV